MAKKKSKKTKQKKQTPKEEKPNITLKDLEAADSSGDDMPPESDWNEETKALYGMIKGGDFDHLIAQNEQELGDDDSIEEVELGRDSGSDNAPSDGEEQVIETGDQEEDSVGEGSAEDDSEEEIKTNDAEDDDEKASEDHEEASSDDEPEDSAQRARALAAKALKIVTQQLNEAKSGFSWGETFDVIVAEPLPFGKKGTETSLDIHDDLKREVAFYGMATDAVLEAREKCEEAGIPFQRPDDFFAEMVKTDDHMAKVKDRLIFETKKIDAVAQRKSNTEQKLRAKESQANKLAEKAKRKRNHMEAVQDWAQSAASNRGRSYDDKADDAYLQALHNGSSINKKRQAMDKKYGYGGKKGRFKQNDSNDLNSPKGFNPRGNFEGGMKKVGAGSKRKGKRARDAGRSRR